MNETSFTFAPAYLRQNPLNRVSTRYMAAARALGTHQVSSRAAIEMQLHRLSRRTVPAKPPLDENNSALLKESFRTSLPLPILPDPGFEEALRHVLSNPGSMVRPRMVLRLGEAYALDLNLPTPSRWPSSTSTPPRSSSTTCLAWTTLSFAAASPAYTSNSANPPPSFHKQTRKSQELKLVQSKESFF